MGTGACWQLYYAVWIKALANLFILRNTPIGGYLQICY